MQKVFKVVTYVVLFPVSSMLASLIAFFLVTLFACILLAGADAVSASITHMTYPPKEQLRDNIEKADVIIQAIVEYEQNYGYPPERLDGLVPDYLVEIPQTVSENDFVFRQADEDIYDGWTLTFYIPLDGSGCNYISNDEFWDCWPAGAGQQCR